MDNSVLGKQAEHRAGDRATGVECHLDEAGVTQIAATTLLLPDEMLPRIGSEPGALFPVYTLRQIQSDARCPPGRDTHVGRYEVAPHRRNQQ